VTLIARFRPFRFVLPAIAAASAIAAAAPSPARPAVRPHPGRPAAISERDAAAVLRYWTPARMASAIPLGPVPRLPALLPALPALLPAPPASAVRLAAARHPEFMSAPAAGPQETGTAWLGGGRVAKTTGRVFFTFGGTDYSCSGSTVASANADVAVTAAHCVNDGTGDWASNWTFVPGYSRGRSRYGVYTARDFYLDSPWVDSQDIDYDFAFIALNRAKANRGLTHAVTAAGGQPIRFGPQPAREYIFGYPVAPPFNGEQLDYCSGQTRPDPYGGDDDAGVSCGMTEGDSGGPWLAGFNPATGTGTITSVSSFKYSSDGKSLYGAEFGSAAESLYNQAQRG
jgi:Trypsin